MSCLASTQDITAEGMSPVKQKDGFFYKLGTGSAVRVGRVLVNKITAAPPPPFTAVHGVMQHRGPSKAACAQRAAN